MCNLSTDPVWLVVLDVRKKIVIEGTSNGLGIRIVGGRNLLFSQNKESDFGIFVKEVIKRSLAEKDGMC